jgi:alpha-L-rhamnosidase
MQKHRNYFPFFKSGYYGTEDNTMQTANILRIFYNLVPEGYEKNVLQVLISDIKARDNHLDTGIIGTKHLFDVLMNYGYGEIAYSIATQKTYPSWGYMIDRGATTLWEY